MSAEPHRPAPAVGPNGPLAALAALATLIAAYLAWLAWGHHGLPVGCGEGGGCSEVLTSRWAALAGIPVGALAIPLYLLIGWAACRPQARWTPAILAFAATTLVGAALWFVLLQAAVLGAFCPWCLAEHALGLVMAGLAWQQIRHRASGAAVGRRSTPMRLAVLCVGLLAALQAVQPPPSTTVRLPASEDPAVAAPGGPAVALLQGQLSVIPQQEPTLGDPAAPRRLYLLFDYCCPHCRRTHEYLVDALAQYPDRFCLICLPMPRDSDCNSAIAETEARFEHACELAELALAVWQTEPAAFADFDAWLFEPSRPPSPQQARAQAAELVSPQRLEEALSSGRPRQAIARNVQAFNESQVAYLPVLMSPGMATMVGRPESREAVLKVLEEELLRITE